MTEQSGQQIATGVAIVATVSAGLCLLIWVVSRSLKRRGLIVPRQTPIKEWVEADRAFRGVLVAIAAEVRRLSWRQRAAWIVGAILVGETIGLILVRLGWAT